MAMGFFNRVTGTFRAGQSGRHDPAVSLATAGWRQRAMLMDVQRDLDEIADELAYIEAETAHSRDHAARLDSDAAAAAADGCADVARDLRVELSQTHAFLAELAEVHQAVTTERDRLLGLREHLTDGPAPTGTSGPGLTTPAATTVKREAEDNAPAWRSS
jgi:hypothetical protein